MTGGLTEADLARMERGGMVQISDKEGLELFDLGRAIDRPLIAPMRVDIPTLRAQAKAGMLPALMSGLIGSPTRRVADGHGSLARRLTAAPESEWDAITLELVLTHVAAVLGHVSFEVIDPRVSIQGARL